MPQGLRRFLSQHTIETVDARGWERISNGELLKAAETAGFEVLITADQNIVYQQNLTGLRIALVVLGSNIWPIVRDHAVIIAERVEAADPGSYMFIEMHS